MNFILKVFRFFIYKLKLCRQYLLQFRKKVFILGTPEYENLGDSAIAVSEMLFLQKCGYKIKEIEEITQLEYINYEKVINFIAKHSIICGVGGGNMGNVWPDEEQFRYSFIDKNTNSKIVIFPQTIYYTDDENGKAAMQESVSHYESGSDLTLVAREKKSYDLMKSLYPNTRILLTPDIVLSSEMKDYGVQVKNREGILCVFRNDVEKVVDDSEIQSIFDYISDSHLSIKRTDMYSDISVTKKNRYELVSKKMQEFADSKLVITDRLHGMIFAAITQTPCIVFSNYNHKVKGTYEWIKHLDYIKYVETAGEAIELIPHMLEMDDCYYDVENIEPLFDDLKKEIENLKNF